MKAVSKYDNNKLKLSEPDSKNSYSKRKTLNDVYPKINSDKNTRFNFNNLKTIKIFPEKEYKKEIKNKKRKINPFKLPENNKYNYDFTDPNSIFNDNNKILKSLNIDLKIKNQPINLNRKKKKKENNTNNNKLQIVIKQKSK